MVYILFMAAVVLSWMLGGQYGSAWRKYGIITALIALGIWRSLHGGIWWQYIPLLLLCPELFLGYGTHSWLEKWLHEDWEIRLAYALMLWLPIALTAAIVGFLWAIPLSCFGLITAFQIHLGSFKIGKKDFLWEDFTRSLTVGVWVVLVVIW